LAVDAAMHVASDGRHGLIDVLRAQLGAAEVSGGVLAVDTERLARGIDKFTPGVGAKLLLWARSNDETAMLAESLLAIGLKLEVATAPPRTVAGFAAERDGPALRVIAVGDGGPAGLAGLKTGDKITLVDGAPPPTRWPELIAKKAPGAPLVLTVARGTRGLELHLTLA